MIAAGGVAEWKAGGRKIYRKGRKEREGEEGTSINTGCLLLSFAAFAIVALVPYDLSMSRV